MVGVTCELKQVGLGLPIVMVKPLLRLFALALFAYENGIPATIKEINSEITGCNKEKPKLVLTDSAKQSKGELEHNI